MDKFKKELREALKLISLALIGVPVFLALLYGFASVMANIFDTPTKPLEQVVTTKTIRQDFARRLADELVDTNNTDLLRLWAASHNISTSNFVSAETLREEIRRKSKDFSIYNNESVFNALFAAMTATDSGVKTWGQVTTKMDK